VCSLGPFLIVEGDYNPGVLEFEWEFLRIKENLNLSPLQAFVVFIALGYCDIAASTTESTK